MLIDCHNGGAFLHRGREIGNRFQVRLDNLLRLNIDGEDLARNQHSPKTLLYRIELKPIQLFFLNDATSKFVPQNSTKIFRRNELLNQRHLLKEFLIRYNIPSVFEAKTRGNSFVMTYFSRPCVYIKRGK